MKKFMGFCIEYIFKKIKLKRLAKQKQVRLQYLYGDTLFVLGNDKQLLCLHKSNFLYNLVFPITLDGKRSHSSN